MQRYYSNIYWHFTGSPEVNWHLVRRPADLMKIAEPPGDETAVATLMKILRSRKLIAACTEKISEELQTEKFCSITDIPFKDLISQSAYYGKVAVGFNADAIHHKFVPVMYISKENLPFIDKVFDNPHVRERPGTMIRELDSSHVSGYLMNFVKITDFATNESHSFYREREWRHLGDFLFQPADVAAIVVPGRFINEVKDELDRFGYRTGISVLSWEFVENT